MADSDHPVWDSVREASRFFMNEGTVHETLRRLADDLAREGISYAVVGGMALFRHGFRRFTEDVDILMTAGALDQFRDRLVGRGYVPLFPGAAKSFRDTSNGIRIEVLTTGEFPGDGKPKPVSFPDPGEASILRDGFPVVSLPRLIEMKLASGLSAPHRMKDITDVGELIVHLDLPLEFDSELDSSVRQEFRRLWKIMRERPPDPHEQGP